MARPWRPARKAGAARPAPDLQPPPRTPPPRVAPVGPQVPPTRAAPSLVRALRGTRGPLLCTTGTTRRGVPLARRSGVPIQCRLTYVVLRYAVLLGSAGARAHRKCHQQASDGG